ncbi:hypothetical protein GH714_032321 [Hevea brasiliensis]|uniref:NADPH-dependent diflavin oxidoreductase 1 n=1 Tax=Hevea brasiliensis TaxID=3981 RepID=A0A6A6LHE3_HEVBR|nr:hypothetical protein GH714_032321 [Hevea brasiliensis]
MEEKPKKLVILYATQTGNAMDAAERLGREAERRGSPVTLCSMDEFNAEIQELNTAFDVLIVPMGFGYFHHFSFDTPSKTKTASIISAIVKNFNDAFFVAKKLDRRLSDLGQQPLLKEVWEMISTHQGKGALDPWMSSLWRALHQVNPKFFPKDLKSIQMQIERARSMLPGKFSHDKSKPDCFLKMVKNQPLTRAGCGRDVRHFEFEFVSSAIKYEVGDVLEVLPGQNPAAVAAFIQRCNLDPESLITVHPGVMESAESNAPNVPIKLKTFVELTMDIASASPRRYFFEARILYVLCSSSKLYQPTRRRTCYELFATAQHEKERLQYFASPEGRDDLYQYNQKERRTVLEVLEDFPSVQMPFEWLVQLVPQLKTRAFSISSSLSAHPNEVHLTVNVVSWTTPFKRKRTGLCSMWLAKLDPQQSTGLYIPAWFHKGLLPPPPPSLPLILVGPGTGCAPFRGFVEERTIQDVSGRAAPILLFFGCRNEENDFLYKDFWLSHAPENGVLSEQRGGGFYVAFSRDQPQKVYVQHKMREHSERIWDLVLEGASIYVAGSSTKMPSDVMAAFEDIISQEAGVSKEAAGLLLRRLERDGRYHVEAWS